MSVNLNVKSSKFVLSLNEGEYLIKFGNEWEVVNNARQYAERGDDVLILTWSEDHKQYVTASAQMEKLVEENNSVPGEFSKPALIAIQSALPELKQFEKSAKKGLSQNQKIELAQLFIGVLLDCGITPREIGTILRQAEEAMFAAAEQEAK